MFDDPFVLRRVVCFFLGNQSLLLFPLFKLLLPLFRFKVSHNIRQKASGNFLADMFRYLWDVALSARITEDEFNPQEETFESTCVNIFLSQEPRGKDFLFLFMPFCFFLTLFTLNFFPILYVLTLTKNGILDTPKGEK